jgi:hypothetical protein
MHGLLQTSFFFGYNAVVCFAFFLMLGSVGWRASLLFVRSIYKVRQRELCCLHYVQRAAETRRPFGRHSCMGGSPHGSTPCLFYHLFTWHMTALLCCCCAGHQV